MTNCPKVAGDATTINKRSPVSNQTMNINELITAILRGGWNEEQLRMISDALRHTYKVGRQQRLTDAQHSMCNGQHVMLKGIRPRRLIGVTGTVENFRIGATRADLRVIDANWNARYHRGDLIRGCPLICFELIPTSIIERATKDANAFGAPARQGATIKGKVGAAVKLAALKRDKAARRAVKDTCDHCTSTNARWSVRDELKLCAQCRMEHRQQQRR